MREGPGPGRIPRPRRFLPASVLGVVLALATAVPASAGPSPALAGDTLTLAPPSVVTYGASATLVGALLDAAGSPVAGAPVLAEARGPDGTWVQVSAAVATDAGGTVLLSTLPTVSTVVRLRHDGGTGAVSSEATVVVRAALTAQGNRLGVALGRQVTLSGTVSPATTGAFVRLERRTPEGWRRVQRLPVEPGGTFRAEVRPTRAGEVRYRVVRPAAGGIVAAVVELAPVNVYRLYRYTLSTRGRLQADVERFRQGVASTLRDPRGWARAHVRFREVRRGGDFTVLLAQARHLPSYSGECSTTYSCRVGRNVIINETRWRTGSPYFPGDVSVYRAMVVNHETGHWLGSGHASCPGPGRPAPVMQQQSKGLQGCRGNPWPLPREVRAASSRR